MNKVNLTLFVNENKKTNPLAPPYTNSKFQPKQDIVLKADTVYEMSLFKNTHDFDKNPYTQIERETQHTGYQSLSEKVSIGQIKKK